MPQDEYWNHNVHYQPVILDAVQARDAVAQARDAA